MSKQAAPTIGEIFDLPDRVRKGDFVLRLAEGVARPEQTLANYVVTPQLVQCFDHALGLIEGAVKDSTSKASYLHGSFGSGKSHFMAVLHLLLQGNAEVRSTPALASVIGKHAKWMDGRRFLLVPYHLIGKRDLESAILDGYRTRVHELHPDAPTPPIYRAESIFENARQHRASLGDEKFFGQLNEGAAASEAGWGALAKGWDEERFEAAVAAAPGHEDRQRLVGDLVDRFFPAYRDVAAGDGERMVALDEGLAILSRHAKELGYDGLILFLDELILWLASHAADLAFINREGQKLAKLVEAQRADRPIPIVSFIARQRDLSELVGEHITGAEKTSFSDILGWWEARFDTITLEDRNLPAIAEQRILKPRSEAARQRIDEAFRETEKIRRDTLEILITRHGNRDDFRQLYPFSPALVETLVAVSFLLQRERTALRVMVQLLVNQRDHLRLGDVVPVGDLFDLIAEGTDAYSSGMKAHFETARRLYESKLLPLLEEQHNLSAQDLDQLPFEEPRARAFRNDDRLVKTLLLSALAPEVDSLKGLTPARLAALNHGTIQSRIPGREPQVVLDKVRRWAGSVGEIKVGDDPQNPTIRVRLSGIDTDRILEQAQPEDNHGNRVRILKRLLFEEIGVEDLDALWTRHTLTWRATPRGCQLLFGNVHELPDESLLAAGDEWKVVMDFPFDRGGGTPADDLARLDRFREDHPHGTRTLVWLPRFLSPKVQRDLGKLAILDHILAGERFDNYVRHLSAVDREQARTLLENQRDQLQARMRHILEGAYGIKQPEGDSLDASHELDAEQQFQSLDDGLRVRPPAAAGFRSALDQLLEQALEYKYPAHPAFPPETKMGRKVLERVLETILQAVASGGRVEVERDLRREARTLVEGLQLGDMGEMHLVLAMHWEKHFERKHAEHGGAITVQKLRAWIDEPRAMGLPQPLQNLVILAYAARTNRAFYQHGGLFEPSLTTLSDELELRTQPLPSPEFWKRARERAASIFGVDVSELCNVTNVGKLENQIQQSIGEHGESCRKLAQRLQSSHAQPAGGEEWPRWRTARAVAVLVEQVDRPGDSSLCEALAQCTVETTEAAMGTSLKKARDVLAAIDQANWKLLEGASAHGPKGEAIWKQVLDALSKDELAVALRPVLQKAEREATELIVGPKPPQPPTRSLEVIDEGSSGGQTGQDFDDLVSRIRAALDKADEARLDLTWKVYRRRKP